MNIKMPPIIDNRPIKPDKKCPQCGHMLGTNLWHDWCPCWVTPEERTPMQKEQVKQYNELYKNRFAK